MQVRNENEAKNGDSIFAPAWETVPPLFWPRTLGTYLIGENELADIRVAARWAHMDSAYLVNPPLCGHRYHDTSGNAAPVT